LLADEVAQIFLHRMALSTRVELVRQAPDVCGLSVRPNLGSNHSARGIMPAAIRLWGWLAPGRVLARTNNGGGIRKRLHIPRCRTRAL